MGVNLTNKAIQDTYEGLVQISGSLLTDGTGSLIPSLDVSASFATTASFAESIPEGAGGQFKKDNTAGNTNSVIPLYETEGAIENSVESIILNGQGNRIIRGSESVVGGESNDIIDSLNATAFGGGHTISGSDYATALGQGATITDSEKSLLQNGTATSARNAVILGGISGNSITNNNDSTIIGGFNTKIDTTAPNDGANTMIGASNSTISGSFSGYNVMLGGIYNDLDTTIRNVLIGGYNNSSTHDSVVIIGGRDLTSSAENQVILGGDVLMSGSVDVDGDITATTFIGDLQGNADTATSASHADTATSASHALQADVATEVNVKPTATSQIFYPTLANDNSDADYALKTNSGLYYSSIDNTLTSINANFTSITASFASFQSASIGFLQSITGSAKIIGDAFIILNNNTPTERYAGLVVQDSGSTANTASFEFDGQTNDWFYEYTDDGGATTEHGVALFGAEYNTKGSPSYPANNVLQKGDGGHHLLDSSITDDGTLVSIDANVSASGYVSASSFIGDGSQLTGVEPFPYTGSAEITGSLGITGSFSIVNNTIEGTELIAGQGVGLGANSGNLKLGGVSNILNQASWGRVVIGGRNNNLSGGSGVSIFGGFSNAITAGEDNAIMAGRSNAINGGEWNGIVGGRSNSIANGAFYSFIGGGQANQITGGNRNGIFSGWDNRNSAQQSVVIGGGANNVNGDFSAIVGGENNNQGGSYGGIFGSEGSTNNANYSNIFGAFGSTIQGGDTTTLVGGYQNTINGNRTIILGGYANSIASSTDFSAILGGQNNTIPTTFTSSVILGGQGITADASDTTYVQNLHLTGSNGGTLTFADGTTMTSAVADAFPYTGSAEILGTLKVIGNDEDDDVFVVQASDLNGGSVIITEFDSDTGAGMNNTFRFINSTANGALFRMEASRGTAKIDFNGTAGEIQADGDLDLEAVGGKIILTPSNGTDISGSINVLADSDATTPEIFTYDNPSEKLGFKVKGGAMFGDATSGNQTDTGFVNFIAGERNTIDNNAQTSFIGGGRENTITNGAENSAIIGANSNTIGASRSTIAGSTNSTITHANQQYELFSSIEASDNGEINLSNANAKNNALIATIDSSMTGTGEVRQAVIMATRASTNTNARFSAIIGGETNSLTGYYANVIAGGSSNSMAQATNSTIAGGSGNRIGTTSQADRNFIGGGNSNTLNGDNAGIIAGTGNNNSQLRAVILGGENNTINGGQGGVVAGGINNVVSHNRSVILGGQQIQTDADDTAYANNLHLTGSGATLTFNDGTTMTTAGGGGGSAFPYTGSAEITGSLQVIGGIIAGDALNDGSGVNAMVLSLDSNGTGERSAVLGGYQGTASGTDTAVIGGFGNQATALRGGVFVGQNNQSTHSRSVVVGGNGLTTSKDDEVVVPALQVNDDLELIGDSKIVGGDSNVMIGSTTTTLNTANTQMISIGGIGNSAGTNSNLRYGAIIGGGNNNFGTDNNAMGQSVMLGGNGNTMNGADDSACIAGGSNTNTHSRSVIIGGTSLSTSKSNEVVVPSLSTNGAVVQNVEALTIATNVAELDASLGNMFTLTLQNGVNTELQLTNQSAGQTFQLQITNNATGAGTISFDSQFDFEGGTAFTATASTSAVDILTFTCFAGGNVQCVSAKNFS